MLRAAMELADEGGIESLTMRELGRRLGVEAAASALVWASSSVAFSVSWNRTDPAATSG